MTERWQYQARAEPVLVDAVEAVEVGWLVQQSGPVFPAPQPVQGTSYVAPVAVPVEVPDIDWFPHAPDPRPLRPGIIAVGNEARAPPANVVALPFDWFVPPADIVRPPAQLVPEQFVLGEPPRIPDYNWLPAQPDVIRPRHQTRPGLFTLVEFSVPVPLDLDWLVEPADVTRPPNRIISEGYVLGEPPTIPAYDWHVSPADVVRPLSRFTPEGGASGQPQDVLPVLDWLVAPADVVRSLHQTRSGFFALVEFSVPVPGVDIDWFVQHPDSVRLPVQLTPEEYVLGQLPIFPAYDWQVQGPEPVLPKPIVPPTELTAGQEIEPSAPDFGWFVQQPGVIKETLWLPASGAVQPVATPLPDFDWQVQCPEPLPVLTRPETNVVLVLVLPTVFLDKWWVQLYQLNPTPTRPASQVTFPLPTIITDFVPIIFELRTCLVPWDLEFNRLLPDVSGFQAVLTFVPIPSRLSRVRLPLFEPPGWDRDCEEVVDEKPDPSGWEEADAAQDPSGWEKVDDTPEPSGQEEAGDTRDPSGWEGIDTDPSPSGWEAGDSGSLWDS